MTFPLHSLDYGLQDNLAAVTSAATPNLMSNDEEHLRLLSIFHYVVGALTAVFACIPLIHLGLGIAMIVSPEILGESEGRPPVIVGWLFAGMGAMFFLGGQTLAVCTILAGRFLAHRTRYWFAFVMACVECAVFPFGTVLGVFTLLVLTRESVKGLFHPAP